MGFFDKDEVPKAPDMSPVINAAKDIGTMSKGIAQETLDWAKTQFAQNQQDIKGYIDNITSDSQVARDMIGKFQDISNADLGISRGALDIKDAALGQAAKANNIADVQGDIQKQQLQNQQGQLQNQQTQLGIQQDFRGDQQAQQAKADQLYQQYSQTYSPAMARYMADAEAYGSPDKVDQARAGAQANVGEQFQGARDAATRQLEAYGVNPASTRFAALDLGTRVKEAAAKAAAGEAAARQREQDAFALRNQAIAQGQQLPTQSTAATNAATAIGSNVNQAGTVANQAGSVGAQFGSLANQAGANQIGATNAATNAMNTATGATNAATSANQAAVGAQSGALTADTAAIGGEQAAGNLTNQTFQTGSQAIGTAPQYLGAANQATSTAGNTMAQQYDAQMKQYKAEKENSSGFGKLLGAGLAIAGNTLLPGAGGAIGGAIGGMLSGGGESGGSASSPLAGLSATDYGSGSDAGSFMDTYGAGSGNYNDPNLKALYGAEGGAIPMSKSPSNGQATDDVPAQLTAGEFVMPKDVTAWYGEKFMQNLIAKAKTEMSKGKAKPAIGRATGPPVVVSRPGAGAGAGAI